MTRRLILSAFAVAGVLVQSAAAQPGGAQSSLAPPPALDKAFMEARRAQMAQDIRLLLRLRPDQEAAWSAFEAALAPPPFDARPPQPPGQGDLTTPRRLDEMAARRKEMEARLDRMEAATRSFYAALSPEQQQAFDAIERLRGPRILPLPGPGGAPPPPEGPPPAP